MKRMVKDWFTTSDGESHDLGRVLWALAILWYFGLGIYAVVINRQLFDFISAGSGIGMVLAGGGAALGFKVKSEPIPPAVQPTVQASQGITVGGP